MKLKIEIELDNSAFEEPGEIERILECLGSRLPSTACETQGEISAHDCNGNWVGYAKIIRGTIRKNR